MVEVGWNEEDIAIIGGGAKEKARMDASAPFPLLLIYMLAAQALALDRCHYCYNR